MYRCFGLADNDTEPTIDGVHISKENYDTYEEVVVNFSMCTLTQLKGILCKFPSIDLSEYDSWNCEISGFTFSLGSGFYVYKLLKEEELTFYPERPTPEHLDDRVDLAQLRAIRIATEAANTTCPYGIVGVDDHVDDWVQFGRTEGLLTDAWKRKLVELMNMGRAAGNKVLMSRLRR